MVENIIGVLSGARGQMFATGEFESPAAFDDGLASLRDWGTRGDAAIWFGRCWAEGVRD
jgi:hypothetical protein